MMPENFDPDFLRDQLGRLSLRHQVAFAAACCERLIPHYRLFSEAEQWGDPHLLQVALDAVWNFARGAEVSRSKLEEIGQECDGVIPDSEDFPTLRGSQALDASVAIYETIQLCLTGDVSHAINVASSARDTVDMFIQERDDLQYSDPQLEEKIARDPLMIRELQTQYMVLMDLGQAADLSADVLQELRARYVGRSNLTLS